MPHLGVLSAAIGKWKHLIRLIYLLSTQEGLSVPNPHLHPPPLCFSGILKTVMPVQSRHMCVKIGSAVMPAKTVDVANSSATRMCRVLPALHATKLENVPQRRVCCFRTCLSSIGLWFFSSHTNSTRSLRETSLDPHRNIEHRLDRLESLLAKIVQRSHTQGVAVPSQPLGTRLVEPRTNLSSSRHVGGSSGQNVLEQTNSRDRPSRTDRRLAPKAPAIITLMRPDASPAASKMVRGAILREALDLYPDIEAVRTCCATYVRIRPICLPCEARLR